MICQKCQKETEEGKFCTNCGAALNIEEAAATTEPVPESNQTPPVAPPVTEQENVAVSTEASTQSSNQSNEFVDKAKETVTDFGDFFLDLLKTPSNAKNINKKALIPSIITIVLFSLIIAVQAYIESRALSFDLFSSSSSFFDGFVLPLFKHLILFGLVAVLTFAAAKVAVQEVSLTDMIAKYGAYLIPFLLLYVVGFIFTVIKLDFPFTSVSTVSLLASVLVVPALILKEKPVKAFDFIYILLVLNLVSYIAYIYLTRWNGFGF